MEEAGLPASPRRVKISSLGDVGAKKLPSLLCLFRDVVRVRVCRFVPAFSSSLHRNLVHLGTNG
jgi:hypothetical protein